jgi:hypothetical protein
MRGVNLSGKYEGKKPFVKPRHRWENCGKMDLRERNYGHVDWFHVAHSRD